MRDTAGSPERARWLHLARSGSQSHRVIWFILPARGASHIINSDKTRVFDQSERVQGPIYILILIKPRLPKKKSILNKAGFSNSSGAVLAGPVLYSISPAVSVSEIFSPGDTF